VNLAVQNMTEMTFPARHSLALQHGFGVYSMILESATVASRLYVVSFSHNCRVYRKELAFLLLLCKNCEFTG
jgi:hypothetical protein